tara:strand:- start:1527 stop:1652 length:126 start_codon:yes stop_codon:yes gene_type:complete
MKKTLLKSNIKLQFLAEVLIYFHKNTEFIFGNYFLNKIEFL